MKVPRLTVSLAALALLGVYAPAQAPPREARAVVVGDRDAAPVAPPANEIDLRSAFAPAAATARKSVATIVVAGQKAALATIISRDGFVITKASELRGPASVQLPGGRLVSAELVGVAIEYDVAMLKVDAQNLIPADFPDAPDPAVGRWLATVGPAEAPIAVGVVSVGRRVIPTDVILGVILAESDQPGARVVQVNPSTGAAKAGVKAEDRIVAIDDEPVDDREDITRKLSRMKPGQSVNVRVQRGDVELDLVVALGLRQSLNTRTSRQNTMGGLVSQRRTGFPAVIQHDMVNLQRSDCGSPVITLDGTIAGLNIARAGRTEMYALPSSVVRELIAELNSGKYPATTHPSLNPPALAIDRSPATAPASIP